MAYPRIASFKSQADFVKHVAGLGIEIPCDETLSSGDESPLSQPISAGDPKIGNRFCILPMEGWDGKKKAGPLIRPCAGGVILA